MNEWYLNADTMKLERLCNTEVEKAQMALEVALHTEQGALLYHNATYGVPYLTIYDDSFELAKLKLSEGIKKSLPSQYPNAIQITREGHKVNVTVELISKTEGSLLVSSSLNS